jgi:hypothetical protein
VPVLGRSVPLVPMPGESAYPVPVLGRSVPPVPVLVPVPMATARMVGPGMTPGTAPEPAELAFRYSQLSVVAPES